ncbi:Arm DNA-binding domain-containing protein [Myroides phaeus]|uniref:Arm DNA-binding domain-containing protein n=1 Tax=Myroides phaeus TaxID=702745 RepID=UPI002DBC94B6|nr:Arm DNA-binding domain-containing protein [Myroides phaeus]MEC4117817.1 Arm DNA-binding domain-containing protein [Myroides phaeus]
MFLIQTKTVPSLIYTRIAVNGQRTEISLKLKTSPISWDNIKGKAKGKNEDTVRISTHIEPVRCTHYRCLSSISPTKNQMKNYSVINNNPG